MSAIDLKAKLAALREKKNAENSQSRTPNTPTNPVASTVPSNTTNSTSPQSKEADEISSSFSLSILDKPIDSNSEGSGNASSTTLTRSESNTSVSFKDLEFLSKLEQLEQMLLVPHPTMPVILRDIHKQISSDPELVTTLTDEQIGIIVNGLKKQTNTELSGTVAKQSKAKDKKIALDVSML